MPSQSDPRGMLLCAAGMTILGASVPISRLVLDYPDLTGQAGRYALAAAAFLVVAQLRGRLRRGAVWTEERSDEGRRRLKLGRRPEGIGRQRTAPKPARAERAPALQDWVRLAALAATGLVAFNVLLLTALRHADPAVVGTVVGGTPLILAIVGPLLRGHRPAARLVLAAAVVIAGGALVHGGGRADAIGLLAALGTLAGEVLFSLLAVPLLPRLGPLRVSTLSCLLAVPMLTVAAVVTGETGRWRLPTPSEAVGYAYLGGLLTVVAFLVWYGGLARLGPERAGLFVGILPAVALAVTALLDGRLPGALQVTGVVVVALGLATGLYSGPAGRSAAAVSPRPAPAAAP